MRRRGDLTHVELVEDDDPTGRGAARTPSATAGPGGPDDASGTGREDAPRSSGRRRGLLVAAGVVVLALVTLAAVQVVVDRRASAVDDRIAALPGASVDLGTELTTLWALDEEILWFPAVFQGRVGVGPAVLDDGAHGVQARDVSTGEVVWSVAVGPPVPRTDDEADPWGGALSCAPPPTGTADPNTVPEVMVCHTSDQREPGEDGPRLTPTWSRVVVVDLATGSVRSSVDVPRATSAAVLDGSVALGRLDDERHAEVVAVDTVTGEERWRYRDPADLPEGTVDLWMSVQQVGGHVAVFDPSGDVTLLSPDGERVDDTGWDMSAMAELGLALPADGPFTRVVRPGLPDLEVIGTLARRVLDDGSAPGLEVSSSGSISWGWDATTGEERWESEDGLAPQGQAAVVVAEGRVHAASTTGVRTLDARTGEVVWTYDVPEGTVQGPLMCDGPHVAVLRGRDDGSGMESVIVLDRRTGELVRELALPEGTQWATPLGPYLVAYGQAGSAVVG
ncbi:PQQ-binding-like beta-propeller repeat protein [Cellulomonas fimi]|uniref:Pyrrolo-quinoline quinone repeat-containing protein n=1 Tax=Cellulomonas fimi (strain ATCC 484 / DSM 20113 / JCM 1341 / CCUG 24087 / LMG 16345 / NBRC 15513 / NCIMB 8980 / NCTC 7547 / NRS-133) TaxID=590998 RepID=F4H4U1_CELFA|nr:PQQ-binding-like beta-propeller repeat protein [Cellulomonas fimi]AEE44292.1 Pyrrolo-quinoline quinone repeat-containing protein [Cellulomonas fimi ATCC 484]NNH05739.1 PQQ-binding-like beta-propeller repeat protein [Cellulomonas fimi]VEH26058.1 Glucose dehydrogenase [Cellulomonas fimi]